ncbi:MAG TPA: cupin domain-containing protein [Gemmatimonadaceae bacterium]|nr:cupin domain-containing protein [Gemmatimonadaceae bacterium]
MHHVLPGLGAADPPRTYDGGGERITILGVTRDGDREWMHAESEVVPGRGPAMHRHPHQVEELTVVEGTLAYVIDGGPVRTAEPGMTVVFPAGVAHRFWNAGDTLMRCTGRISPPMRFEAFIAALYRSFAEHGGRRPGLFDLAFLLHHFAEENELAAIPRPVRAIVFPVLRAIGRATGRYRKFRDL